MCSGGGTGRCRVGRMSPSAHSGAHGIESPPDVPLALPHEQLTAAAGFGRRNATIALRPEWMAAAGAPPAQGQELAQ